MGKSKKKIGIIIGVCILILIVAVVVMLYFTTDFLKATDTLFYKYASQSLAMVEDYAKNINQTTIDTIKQNTYNTKADVSFDLVTNDEQIATQIPPRNFSISYNKSADPAAKKDASDISLKFLNKEIFNVKYAHNDDSYGLTSAEVVNKYLVVDNNNLKQLAQKLGIQDVTAIPNRIDNLSLTDLLQLTQSEKDYLTQTYLPVIMQQIPKENYAKESGVTIQREKETLHTNSYSVSLTNTQIQNIITAVLQQVRQDDTMINLILQKMRMVDSQTTMDSKTLKIQIDNAITQINTATFSNVKITVFEANGQIARLQVDNPEMGSVQFDFEKSNNAVRIIMNIEYAQTNGTSDTNTNTNTNTIDDDGYVNISGNNQVNEPSNPTSMKLTSLEFAKQQATNTSNNIIIATFQYNEEIVKFSIQDKTDITEQTMTITDNWIVNVNISDTTYFTIKMNAQTTPAQTASVVTLDESNAAIVNNFTPAYITNLYNGILQRLQQLYTQKLEQVKIAQQEENVANGLNPVDPNAPEANTIVPNNTIVGQ